MRCASVAIIAIAGCGESAPPPIEGEIYRYVAGDIRIPERPIDAGEALDLEGDERADNQLGLALANLESNGFGVAATAREALIRGNAIMLVELQTTSFADSNQSGLVTYLGANPEPAACSDPADVSTCGQHLTTRASFEVLPGTASGLARGPFEGGRFLAPAGRMPIEIAFDVVAPLRVVLHGARIQVMNMSPAGGSALFGGGITMSDVDTVIVPEAARRLARIVADECEQPAGGPPCGCVVDERADLVQKLFDSDDDCMIDAPETRSSSITAALLAPDITIDGEPMMSFCVPIELVPAAFEPPPGRPGISP